MKKVVGMPKKKEVFDYVAALVNQIKELEKVQSGIEANNPDNIANKCHIANCMMQLTERLHMMYMDFAEV